MKEKLSLQEKLRDLRYEQGNQKLEQVSAATGISTSALSSYEKDELMDIPHSSIVALAKHYHVSTDYLLGLTENRNEDNAGIRELSINYDMTELLKSGSINNRLLCELVTHPGFIRFLTDLDPIAKDLREAHKKDTDAAPVDMIAAQINTAIEDVKAITDDDSSAKKNLIDLLLYFFSKELRIPLDKLTREEKETLISIFERSGRYKAELRNMTKGRKKKR